MDHKHKAVVQADSETPGLSVDICKKTVKIP